MKPNHPVLPGSLPASRPQSRGISLTMQFLKDAWIFLPAVPYFVVVLQNAPNVPIMDDYDAILAFLNNWRGADLMGKLSLLFQQYNEHRLLHSRIVYVLYYSLFGNVDFRNLILLADLQLVIIASVSVYFIRMSGAPFDFDNSLCFGLLILAGLIALLVIRPAKAPWPMLCILGFALASMGTSSLFRACLKDAQFQTSRYLIYPQLLIAVACLLVWLKMEKMQYKWAVLTVIAVGMLRIYSSNFEFGKLGFMRTTARAKAYIYWHPHKEAAKQISDSACQSGIYCLESEKNKLLSEAE